MRKMMLLALALVFTLVLSACGGGKDSGATPAPAEPPSGDVQEVVIKASNWDFDQAEYHVKKGQPVQFTLVNEQGMHGFEIKKIGVDIKKNNGTQTVTIDKAGTYDIVCNVLCGTGHAKMVSKLIVE